MQEANREDKEKREVMAIMAIEEIAYDLQNHPHQTHTTLLTQKMTTIHEGNNGAEGKNEGAMSGSEI